MPLDQPEYARIKLDVIPQEFIEEYNLMQYSHNGWVYFEITMGIYGLKQASKLANNLLTKQLAAHSYYQCTTQLVYGDTNGGQYSLSSLWKILASKMLIQ
jgi:hypothetical protein